MKTTLRMPDALADEAQRRADWLGVSLNALVAIALDAYLGMDRPRGHAVRPVSVGKVSGAIAPAARAVGGSEGPANGPEALLGLPGLSRQQRRMLERQSGKQADKRGGAS